MSTDQITAEFSLEEGGRTLKCRGCWTISNVKQLADKLKPLTSQPQQIEVVDGSEMSGFDSAGALLLNEVIQNINGDNGSVKVAGLKRRYDALYKAVVKRYGNAVAVEMPARKGLLYQIGFNVFEKLNQLADFINFTGELSVLLLKTLARPRKFPWRDLMGVMDETGYRALGIVGLMAFLIGVVLAYQLAVQLRQYGANIFIVDTTGIAILREFAPLITAIIMAGRTSTAFTALIGTMKVNEEIDALRTMGIQPVQRLVLPRIISLILTLPLLVVWADMFGVFGSMVMAKNILHINFHSFLERFDVAVSMRHYVLGLIKTPVFALIISGVGCFQGFAVSLSAESVGKQTTKAAVQSIFLIIIADALFSVIFSMMDL